MMNRRIILSRFCATLSACALALALASPAWSADPAGQAEIQLAKNHIESLKKPMPALSGKALQAFKNSEKAFKASKKQKPRKPTRAEVRDICNKDKTCREQMRFIEKEMKKKKSGSLNFGLPDLASALNPFQVKEAQASHISMLWLDSTEWDDTQSSSWKIVNTFHGARKVSYFEKEFRYDGGTNDGAYKPSITSWVTVPMTGWYILITGFVSKYGVTLSSYLKRFGASQYYYPYPNASQGHSRWWYLSKGSHMIQTIIEKGDFTYKYSIVLAYS